MQLADLVFYLLALLTVGSAAVVAFSRNVVYAAFSLMGTFLGAAGLYVFLAADFVAVVQVLIYVGGILVLMVFAVMLTHRIEDVQVSNRSVGTLPALLVVGAGAAILGYAVVTTPWRTAEPVPAEATTRIIGDLFLGDYLLPFELASVVLLAALIGAVSLSRKELRRE